MTVCSSPFQCCAISVVGPRKIVYVFIYYFNRRTTRSIKPTFKLTFHHYIKKFIVPTQNDHVLQCAADGIKTSALSSSSRLFAQQHVRMNSNSQYHVEQEWQC